MRAKGTPAKDPEDGQLENKMFRLKPEAIRAFDILKAEQGARSGPGSVSSSIGSALRRPYRRSI